MCISTENWAVTLELHGTFWPSIDSNQWVIFQILRGSPACENQLRLWAKAIDSGEPWTDAPNRDTERICHRPETT